MKLALALGLLILCSSKLVTYRDSLNFSEGSWLVMYFAPWCAHCKTLKPSFIQAAALTPTKLVLVDCEEFEKHCSTAGVKKFPTLIYYSEDLKHQYNYGRTTKDLNDFLLKVNSPTYSNATLDTIPYHETSFTLHLKPSDKKVFASFADVAREHRTSLSYFYTVPDTSTYLRATGADASLNYTLSDLSARSIREFVEIHVLPTVVELNSSNFQAVRLRAQEKVLLLLAYDKSEESAGALQVFHKVATDLRRRQQKTYQACTINFETDGKQLEYYNVDRAPTLLKVIIQEDNKLYAKRSEGLDEIGMYELISRMEMVEIGEGMWVSAKKLFYRVITLQVFTDNLLVVGIVTAIVAGCMGIAYWDTNEKNKND
mmetsp:Transcript_7566/g.14107  ORF Transcript_7566/g.14107 Transcript_7566/m.14107 type:complete len:371 (+) Transcript_7566:3264-4376(+)|eukprot:CAMPEP_0204905288 /NCGR_PEP_ID=MMETSP1397-20131031/5338_1 /ASSEMBLY_ACC=CAM_ASM_000891 /TAXON_ID=49980 /ORGANISM="Climacostomum Climacostomum virens, Strain Stock W-24" /LENGTH=370 /DNA_ID=CAMNT_0052074159 /DNA_START=3262 /DNA_END=4374 /DNA_ORIENTATION=+